MECDGSLHTPRLDTHAALAACHVVTWEHHMHEHIWLTTYDQHTSWIKTPTAAEQRHRLRAPCRLQLAGPEPDVTARQCRDTRKTNSLSL